MLNFQAKLPIRLDMFPETFTKFDIQIAISGAIIAVLGIVLAVIALNLHKRVRELLAITSRSEEELEKKVKAKTKELSILHEIATVISQSLKVEEMLTIALSKVIEITEADIGGIHLIDSSGNFLDLVVSDKIPTELSMRLKKLKIEEGLASAAVQKKTVIGIDVAKYPQNKICALFTKHGFRYVLSIPIVFKDTAPGAITVAYKKPKISTEEWDIFSLLRSIGMEIGVALNNAMLFEQVESAKKDLEGLLISTITSLVSAIDAKSPWTKGHSERVTNFALEIAREMGLKDEDLEHLKLCGLLHDIGKIGIYDGVLDKPGKLTDEEFELIKKHPVMSMEILNPIKQLSTIIPGILHHHERYDGKGYPEGISGDDIPLCARILCVADSFDAMTAERPYKPPRGIEDAKLELKRCSGTQFDPKVVEAFLKALEREYAPIL